MSNAQSPRAATVRKLLEGYGSLSVPQLLAPLSDDFHHQILPSSLSMPALDREEFGKHAAGIFGVFEKFEMVPQSQADGGPGSMVVVHARMLGTLKGGKGEWTNECVMMIRLSDDGTEIVEMKEFVDSFKAREMARSHAPENFGCESSLDGILADDRRHSA